MIKKYLKGIFIAVVSVLILIIPINAKADGLNKQYIKENKIVVNNNYNVKSPKNILSKTTDTYNSVIESCSNLQEIQSTIEKHISNRRTEFTVRYLGDCLNLKDNLETIIDNVIERDDYLAYSYSGFGFSADGYEGNVKIKYKFNYLTTKDEEIYVDNKVHMILSKIITKNMNEDDKERAIHDYIVKNVTYDTTLIKHSAYDALSSGSTVCQGYALLAYKMLKEVGIEARIVKGYGDGESHAWNLVKIRDKWYHLDCTWDDPIPDVGNVSSDYYNLNDFQMSKDHSWDKSKYPAANTIYAYLKENSNDKVNINLDNYRKWRKKSNVPSDKVWTIAFKGGDVDKNSINRDNVYIFDENSKCKVDVNWEVIGNRINVVSKSAYKEGHTYYLVIEKSVSSSKGKEIPSPILMKFSVLSNGNFICEK